MTPHDENDTYRLLREKVLRYARRRFPGADPEDLTQEALIVVWNRYRHLPPEDLLPLGCRICANVFLNVISKRSFSEVPLDPSDIRGSVSSPSPEDEAIRDARDRYMKNEIDSIDYPCNEFLKHVLNGMSLKEIAIAMDANMNTVYTWNARCKAYLTKRLALVARTTC